MSDLIARLEAVGGGVTAGDWPEVVERATSVRRRAIRRRVLIAIAVALLAVPAIAVATRYFDLLSLTATEEEVPLPQGENTLGYVLGERLQLPGRPPAKLGARLLAPFVPPETHLVIPSPDGTQVVYHSWSGTLATRRRGWRGTPVLRVFDAETGRDTLLARGAHSPAWRADGALAYTRAGITSVKPRGVVHLDAGHLVVRPLLDRPEERWSTFASRWSHVAWAGRYLVARAEVRRPFEGGGFTSSYQLHAFSAPGVDRRLPLGGLIAISPDGRYVFGNASPSGGQGSDSRMRLVDVASGRIVDEIVQSSGPGAWSGDTIILTTGLAPEPLPPSPEGLRVLAGADHVKVIVLRFSDGKLALERELRLSRDVIERTGLKAAAFYFGFGAPAFVDDSTRQFTTRLVINNTRLNRQIENILVFLTCDRIEVRCRRGRSLDPRRIMWSALVDNPSRPLPD